MHWKLDKDGYIGLPPGPGLGVEIDEKLLEEAAKKPQTLPLAGGEAARWVDRGLLNAGREHRFGSNRLAATRSLRSGARGRTHKGDIKPTRERGALRSQTPLRRLRVAAKQSCQGYHYCPGSPDRTNAAHHADGLRRPASLPPSGTATAFLPMPRRAAPGICACNSAARAFTLSGWCST